MKACDFVVTDLFKMCGNSPSIAVILDFPTDSEMFFIGDGESIRKYVYDGLPDNVPKGILRHKSKIGFLVKNINQLMNKKRELNEISDIAERLCNVDALCDGSCNFILDELVNLYENVDFCNVLKNYIVYSVYCAFVKQQALFNKKIGLTVKGNHDKAKKYISEFHKDADKIISPFLVMREKKFFTFGAELYEHENVSEYVTYQTRFAENIVTVNAANGSAAAFLGMYADMISAGGMIIDNCEICGNLIVADRKNYAPVCNKTKCRKEHRTGINTSTRSRTLENPANKMYVQWDDKCTNYRKKLLPYPDLLEKYDTAREKFRARLKKMKKGLTARSKKEDLEKYGAACDDAAIELQEFAKNAKKRAEGKSS